MQIPLRLKKFTKKTAKYFIFLDILKKICYNYSVMDITYKDNNIILENTADFNIHHIFECGQCFRWNRTGENAYTGVAKGHALKIEQSGERITLFDTTAADFENIWYDYFDLSRDYSKIKSELSKDAVLKKAVSFGGGIRILKQDLWETVVSFIISASNNIPRIKKIIELLCRSFGEPIHYQNGLYYSFPDFRTLSALSVSDLGVIKAGFRDKYIKAAADAFTADEASFSELSSLCTADAEKKLMSLYGVGSKVAGCILLFGLAKTGAFPVDVWIKRTMEALYFGGSADNTSIQEFARSHFGEYAGIAQQYLFFYARENNLGV